MDDLSDKQIEDPNNCQWVKSTSCGSNEICTGAEEELARAVLSEARGVMQGLREEITGVEKLLESLVKKHKNASQQVDKLAVALAPHKRLPQELLSQIFVHTMEGMDVSVPPVKSMVPNVLGEVCSRWRAVAHTNPQLWNHLRVFSGFSREASGALCTIISRSGSSPMYITLRNDYMSVGKSFFDTLGNQSHRIRGLRLTVDTLTSEVLAASSYPFTLLRYLDVVIRHGALQSNFIPTTLNYIRCKYKTLLGEV